MFLRSVDVCGFRAAAEKPMSFHFPGRFSVVVGPNNSGKSTIAESIYWAHPHSFPQLQRPPSTLLGPNPRQITVAYEFEPDPASESPLGLRLRAEGAAPPSWVRPIKPSLGSIQMRGIEDAGGQGHDQVHAVYLPAYRNPVDDLARREAQVLIELLRTEQARLKGHKNLANLRALASHLLDGLNAHDLIQSVEKRIAGHLTSLSSGVEPQFPFMGRQIVDDAFLGRVLELLLSAIDDRAAAGRLDLSGLGYVNLLHIAVILAAIPGTDPLPATPDADGVEVGDPAPEPATDDTVVPPDDAPTPAVPEPEPEPDVLAEAADEADTRADSIFESDQVHAVVIIEEPEAHLHPQLQHGLIRYLRRTVVARPELQIILTTHSSEIITACNPTEVVVLRREVDGTRVCRPLNDLPLPEAARTEVLRRASLHFDATRSAAFMAERLVIVEGITDALLLRVFGRVWAGGDETRRNQVDSLTIIPIGSKVGRWSLDLLASPGHELVQRVAVLMDTDDRESPDPVQPAWVAGFDNTRTRVFLNHPTLEPAITPSNEAFVAPLLAALFPTKGYTTSPTDVDIAFKGSGKKGEFAFGLARAFEDASPENQPTVPAHFVELFEFLFPDLEAPAEADPMPTDDEPTTSPPESDQATDAPGNPQDASANT